MGHNLSNYSSKFVAKMYRIIGKRLFLLLYYIPEKQKGRKPDRGTPDKSNTPGPDDDPSCSDGHPSALNDEEIQALTIRQDELIQVCVHFRTINVY